MDFSTLDDDQAHMAGEALEALTSLCRGYDAFLMPSFSPPTVQLWPPSNELAAFHLEESVIQPLLNKNWVRKLKNSYKVTTHGQDFYDELSHLSDEGRQRCFAEKIRLQVE
jgi:hypothetical protein